MLHMVLGFRILGLLITLAIAYFVYQDAEKRGMNAILWAVLTFLCCPITVIVYLIMRTQTPSVPPPPL